MNDPGDGRICVMPGDGTGYDVIVAPGALADLPALAAAAAPAARYVVIADSNVADLYGSSVRHGFDAAGHRVHLLTFPAGEASKTRASWSGLTDDMLRLGVGRDGCVVALGGGVTGDLAGFVAATYMRGIPVVQAPTSLLAMIDASVGGKTAVDVPAGKNLVGAFHQPRVVVADPEVLHTLPKAELRSGCAEAVKHGAIADAAYLEWATQRAEDAVAGVADVVEELVLRSVRIKARLVAQDVHERGARSALNFGHTLGHALEHASGWRLSHGHAVAVGMVLEARLGEAVRVTDPGTARILAAGCRAFGLPTGPPAGMDPDAILHATRADKKARSDRVRYTLLEGPGAVAKSPDDGWTHAVPDDAVRGVLGGPPAA